MATPAASPANEGSDTSIPAALQHRPWRRLRGLSSALLSIENFLGGAGFDRGPWLAVGFAGGIGLWLGLANSWQWLALIAPCLGTALFSATMLRADGGFPWIRQSLLVMPLIVAAGCAVIWTKSGVMGAQPIERPIVALFTAELIGRVEQPAEGRIRLLLSTHDPQSERMMRVRVNLPIKQDSDAISEGAILRLKLRLMPPAAPMLPGGYDFARAAWFAGISATGSVLGSVEVVQAGQYAGWIKPLQRNLSAHVRSQISGSSGSIAAALASGDRGAIAESDETAMRDSGLTHLLSISGLHVSAVVAAAYFLAMRLLALWPWLALRVRLPLAAAGAGALAGISYTLLTGAEVPTIRSCIGAVLVLAALALGREPLSLRMLAVAAFLIMLLWPEAVAAPGFQMSFASVIAIVAFHGSAPVRHFLAPRDENWPMRGLRLLAMLLVTGVVIELALMPIGLFHFHRAGVYGALANVIAIPLTTFVSMPLVALALIFDVVGAGAPFWWMAGKSIDVLLGLAHWTAAQPGAVSLLPTMSRFTIALFVAGGLWLALWRGRVRLLGLLPVVVGLIAVMQLQPPDILISGDGRHVGITGESAGELLVLRDGSRSSFARENLTETAGMSGAVRTLAEWPNARCSRDFCALEMMRGGRQWRLLISRGRDQVEERALAAACDRADIVIADRWLPRSCKPAWIKADRRMLERSGGLALDLTHKEIRSVADTQGKHGWWREPVPYRKRITAPAQSPST